VFNVYSDFFRRSSKKMLTRNHNICPVFGKSDEQKSVTHLKN